MGISRAQILMKERAALIYSWDKVAPEDRKRYNEIQKELRELEDEKTQTIF